MNENRQIELLEEILEEIQLLSVSIKSDALQKFNKEFITSDLKQEMYNSFDGMRTLQQISEDIKCKINTLQIFAQQLIERNLVDFTVQGKSRILKKSTSKIALYYTNKSLEDGGGISGY
ncbi:MAG: hypothetical protein QM657_03110 [Lacrimispora sp.]|uniref:hypothetical protein n=1 Tax=Lacrimispora sp. TaxID=2719234 RepID=UPI0039E33B5F